MRSFLRQGAAHLAPAGAFLEAELQRVPGWAAVRASLLRLWTNDMPGLQEFPKDYKLLSHEDLVPWIVFFVTFIVLILVDNLVLHRHDQKLTFNKALLFSLFWLACAGFFCIYIYFIRGPEDAFAWGTGYLLEWMLSVDNLFVFRSIFMYFRTPDSQKHKPLFWGIVGAVFFRMIFFMVEEVLVHTFSWMYFLLGIFLIYTGIKVVFADDEEVNPSDSPIYNRIIQYVPYNDRYSPKARFCDWVPVVPAPRKSLGSATPPLDTSRSADGLSYASGTDDDTATKYRLVATRLTLVVICLEVTDIVFAVDSVSAIVAQIPDLFLAYTACVFAMLGLRATFFVVDELVALFTLLPYAVGGILVLLGAKLLLRKWIHVPPEIVCITLFSLLFLSVIGSIIVDRLEGKTGFEACIEAMTDCSGGKPEADNEDREVVPSWAQARCAGSRKTSQPASAAGSCIPSKAPSEGCPTPPTITEDDVHRLPATTDDNGSEPPATLEAKA